MSASNTFETNLLTLIFINTDCPNVGDATGLRGSTTAGVFWISLHTGTANDTNLTAQNSQEAAYGSYARQDEPRSASGWTVTAGVCDNDNVITFPQATSGSETETSFGIGSDTSGVGNLHMWGSLTSSLAVSTGITPSFAVGALDVTLD